MTSRQQPALRRADARTGRCIFLIEGLDPGDALLRVLGVACVQQAVVTSIRFDRRGPSFEARLEIEDLGVQRAEHLSKRLAQLPVVTGVSFGGLRA